MDDILVVLMIIKTPQPLTADEKIRSRDTKYQIYSWGFMKLYWHLISEYILTIAIMNPIGYK